MAEYIIYCDGAYSSNRNIGGISFVILNSEEKVVCQFYKAFRNTTNQRMEQMAAAIALESIKSPSNITIYSDSAYVVNTYEQNWGRKCNNDLWDRLDKAINNHIKVKFIHIRGHKGNKYNEIVDKLAVLAYENI